jgi:hypothetical protein
VGRPGLRACRPRRGAQAAPGAGAARAGVVGRAAPARARPEAHRPGQGHVLGVDAPRARLRGRVPRVLGPARGLRLRRRDPDDHGRHEGGAGQDDAGGVRQGVPRAGLGVPARRRA